MALKTHSITKQKEKENIHAFAMFTAHVRNVYILYSHEKFSTHDKTENNKLIHRSRLAK